MMSFRLWHTDIFICRLMTETYKGASARSVSGQTIFPQAVLLHIFSSNNKHSQSEGTINSYITVNTKSIITYHITISQLEQLSTDTE